MDIAKIAQFCESGKINTDSIIKFDFKKRNAVMGQFIHSADYEYLKSKNFWRIVIRENIEAWRQTKNVDIARIYNGAEFSRLSLVKTTEPV